MKTLPQLPQLPRSRDPQSRSTRAIGILAVVAALAAAAALPGVARAGDGGSGTAPSSAAAAPAATWPSAIVDIAAYLPVQDGGRVMPLQSYADFLLLRVNHQRSVKDPQGRTLKPLEWLLDAWLRPEAARRCDAFLVETYEVLDALQLEHEGKKKRDRYSYEFLLPARERLSMLASNYVGLEEKDRSPVEGGIVDLEGNLRAFEAMLHLFDFARADLDVTGSPALRALFGGADHVSAKEVFAKGEDLLRLSGTEDPHGDGAEDPAHGGAAAPAHEPTPDEKAARALRLEMVRLAEEATALAFVPPAGTVDSTPRWWSPGDLVYAASQGIPLAPDLAKMLAALTAMGAAHAEASTVEAEMRRFSEMSATLAERRGENGKIALEVFLFRLDPFYRGVWLYVFAFLVLAVTWLKQNRWVLRGAWALLFAGLALHATGIVIRCILRERPPVKTLYETALFISAVGVIGCMVAERINRRGIALAMAPVLGGLGLFIANTFEALEGKDTMRPLVAVLDTNFWLATHVTCITIGYSGGLLASLLAHVHVLGRAVGLKRGNDDFYRTLGRMTYGMLAFGLVFSVVGTILGGIWANESWGRFWGWDPKENGALMICLAELAVLHARMGGYLKPYGIGFSMACIGVGCVVLFSWWGVNLLGIGLHSYGFTSGIMTALMTVAAFEVATLLVGAAKLFLGRTRGGPPTAVSA